LRGYGPKHVCVGVKYENELTVLVAEADGDDKHRNTGNTEIKIRLRFERDLIEVKD